MRASPRGFTLLELLVVLAILGVMAGLIAPALAYAGGVAESVKCQSNLGQWALAMRVYTQQNNGALPRRGQGVQPTAVVDRPEDWFNAIPQAVGCRPTRTSWPGAASRGRATAASGCARRHPRSLPRPGTISPTP